MAHQQSNSAVLKATTAKAGAAPAAPAAAEQLGNQPAAPMNGATSSDVGTSGQDAQPDTAKGAPGDAAPTSQDAGDDALKQALDALAAPVEALFIRSVSPRGFRRCGHRFTPEGHGIALDVLTDDQIKTLAEDPNLRVELSTFSGKPE